MRGVDDKKLEAKNTMTSRALVAPPPPPALPPQAIHQQPPFNSMYSMQERACDLSLKIFKGFFRN